MEVKATAASVEAMAKKLLFDAEKLASECDDDHATAKHLHLAAEFLKIVAELEQAGIEHSDAVMITTLIGQREKRW